MRLRPGLRPDPAGELTALPQTLWLDLRGLLLRGGRGRGRERPTYKGREVKGGRGGEVREGEGKGWKGRGREMEGPTYKGREGREKRERERPPGYYGSPPGHRGARIVTDIIAARMPE